MNLSLGVESFKQVTGKCGEFLCKFKKPTVSNAVIFKICHFIYAISLFSGIEFSVHLHNQSPSPQEDKR